MKRAQAQLKQRQRDRQEGLGPFFDKLVVSLPIEAQTTFPPIVNLLKFDGVRPLWEADDAVQDDAALNLAKPLILAEATAFARQFEIATFSKLAKAHAESTAVKDPDAPTTYSSGASHSATDMAMLASRITSSFVCPATGCSCMKPYPEILAHWREGHARFFSAAEASYWPPVATFDDWTLKTTAEHIQAIRVILSAVNKDPSLPAASEATTNVAELDAIGKRFECIECPTGPWESVLQDDEPPMLFTWSDLVSRPRSCRTRTTPTVAGFLAGTAQREGPRSSQVRLRRFALLHASQDQDSPSPRGYARRSPCRLCCGPRRCRRLVSRDAPAGQSQLNPVLPQDQQRRQDRFGGGRQGGGRQGHRRGRAGV